MIKREKYHYLITALQKMPVVTLIGPRQAGKTTLALEVSKQIENPVTSINPQK